MQKILLIDDSPDFQALVKATLKDVPAEITSAETCREAEDALARGSFDLVLLDVLLPDGDGFALCSKMREQMGLGNVPVIFLTVKSELDERVRGFSLGAEDYILKPLEPIEFKARVTARLKNLAARREENQLRRGAIRIDYSFQRAFVKEESAERELHLTPAEFRILAYLMSHAGQTFRGKELLKAIWGEEAQVVDHNLYTHIYSLRKKLGEHAATVESLPRGGYRFAG